MVKKVAILLPWLKMGGTNKVALRFIRELMQYCEVTLVLSQNTGELIAEIPEELQVIIDTMQGFKDVLKSDIHRFRICFMMKDVLYYAKIKLNKDSIDNYKYLVKRNDMITEQLYDCAISYHGQSPERLLNLLYRINAKKKVVWIHGEMSFPKRDCQRMKKYYSQIDHFFFVSKSTMQAFQNTIGIERKKCTVYYNPIDKKDIIELSEKPMEIKWDQNYINLLTVGRISEEKGQDMIPQISKELIHSGYKIRWYLIGDGDKRSYIENLIRENQLEDNVKLLGTKINPYCYMKACDIYVQPSYTEGYSTTICEAGILGKAIIGTKPSGGIREQITDGVDGLIVDATVDGLKEGIVKLIDDKKLHLSVREEIKKKNFEGKGEIKKFLAYLE